MHSINTQLTENEKKLTKTQLAIKDEGTAVTPVPDNVKLVIPRHQLGNPKHVWEYRDGNNSLIFCVVRFITLEGNKENRPLTYRKFDDGSERWAWKSVNAPRPLYGLDRLAENPNAIVVVCEGEKAADAAGKLLPGYKVVTSPNGSSSASKARWDTLKGRNIVIWPDNDEAGIKYLGEVSQQLLGIAESVKVLTPPSNKKVGWDAADALEEGWNVDDAEAYLATAISATSMVNNSSYSPDTTINPLQSEIDAPQPYPIDALPPIIKDAVYSYHEYGQQPVEMIAMSALSNVSLACQGLANIARDDVLTGPISLNFLLAAESGERKTSADNAFSEAARKWEEEKMKAMESESAIARGKIDAHKYKKAGVQQAIVCESKKKNKDNIRLAQLEKTLISLEQQAPHMPIVPELFYEDATRESFTEQLAFGYPSVALLSDEGGIIVGSYSMSKEQSTGTFAFLNRLWDGKPYKRHRVTQTTCTVKDRRVTCSIMLQLSVLKQLVFGTDGQSRGTGFLARQLLSYPKSTIGGRIYKKPPLDDFHMKAFHSRITEMLNMPLPTEGKEMYLKPPTIKLSEEARIEWVRFYNEIEYHLGKFGELEMIKDFASKSADNAARIAANLQIFQCSSVPEKVSKKMMISGIEIARWHLYETRRIFGFLDVPEKINFAQMLLDWILEKGLNQVNSQKIAQYGPNKLRNKVVRDTAIRTLLEHNYLIESQEGKSKTYVFNPQAIPKE